MVTKAQQMMIDDGLPPAAIISEEERKATWADSAAWAITHSKPHKDRNMMNIESPDFAAMDMEALKEVYSVLTAEARDRGLPVKSLPADITLPKLIKFCEDLSQLIRESKAEKKSKNFDNSDIAMQDTAAEAATKEEEAEKATEEVAELHAEAEEQQQAEEPAKKKAVKKKAKKEEPKEELKDEPKEEPKKVAPKKAAKAPVKKAPAKKAPAKKEPTKKTDQLPISAALGLRSGSLHEKIAVYLEDRIGKMVKEKDIVKHLYGDPNVKTNRIKDLMKIMNKNKYEIRKEDKNGTVSYGLYAKKG